MSSQLFADIRAPPSDHLEGESPTQTVEHEQKEPDQPPVAATAVKPKQKELEPSLMQMLTYENLMTEPIVQRFRGNGLSTGEIVQVCNSYDHDVLMKLPPPKVWIAKFANSSLDDAFEMRFMCTSLAEFVDLAAYGSMDDLRRVYLTLDKRLDMQASMLELADILTYRGHPALGMHDVNNPEYDTVKSAYEMMIGREKTYMSAIDKAAALEEQITSNIVRHYGCENPDLSAMELQTFYYLPAHAAQRAMVASKGIPAKSWMG